MRCTLVGSYLFRLPLPHSSFLFISDRHLSPRRCARLSVIIYQLQRWKAFTDAHHCWSNVRSASTRCYQPKAIFPCLCKLLFIPSYVGCIQGTEKEMWNISCHKSLKHFYMGGKFSLKLKLVKVLDNSKPYSHVDILPPNVPESNANGRRFEAFKWMAGFVLTLNVKRTFRRWKMQYHEQDEQLSMHESCSLGMLTTSDTVFHASFFHYFRMWAEINHIERWNLSRFQYSGSSPAIIYTPPWLNFSCETQKEILGRMLWNWQPWSPFTWLQTAHHTRYLPFWMFHYLKYAVKHKNRC